MIELFLLASCLMLITASGVFFSQQYPNFFYSISTINLVAIILATQSLTFYKIIFMLIGTMIVISTQIFFYLLRNNAKSLTIIILRQLKELNREIFSCFLQPEYVDNLYLFERRLHVQKKRAMKFIVRLDQFGEAQPFNNLYDMMLNYAQLRRRISDPSVFEICRVELTAIFKEIDEIFSHMIAMASGKKYSFDTSVLAQKIDRLEENNQQVLQVASREPVAFLLFIAGLRALRETISIYNPVLVGRS